VTNAKFNPSHLILLLVTLDTPNTNAVFVYSYHERIFLFLLTTKKDHFYLTMSETDGLMERGSVTRFPTIGQIVWQGSVVQRVEGSMARDHLANERTFLAWIRTGLSLTGLGIGLLKIAKHGISDTACYLIIGLGLFMMGNATRRYLHVMRLLTNRHFEPNVVSILSIVAAIMIVILGLLYLHLIEEL